MVAESTVQTTSSDIQIFVLKLTLLMQTNSRRGYQHSTFDLVGEETLSPCRIHQGITMFTKSSTLFWPEPVHTTPSPCALFL